MFTLNLTEQQMLTLGKALALLPYGEVVATVQEINKQVQEQLSSKEAVNA